MVSQKMLIDGIAEETKLAKKDIKRVLDVAGELTAATIRDEEVRLFQGLTIAAVERPARVGRNPRTGETIQIPSKFTPKAKFGKYFKEAVN